MDCKMKYFNHEFYTITFIDTTINLVKLVCIDTKARDIIAAKFVYALCLSLIQVVHDYGGKQNIGYAFACLSKYWELKTSRNRQKPTVQYNIWMYASDLGNSVQDITPPWPSQTQQAVFLLVDNGFATAIHSMRSNISAALKMSPDACAYSQDLFLNAPIFAAWQSITYNHKIVVNNALIKKELIAHQLQLLCWTISSPLWSNNWGKTCHQSLQPVWDCKSSCEWYRHYSLLNELI